MRSGHAAILGTIAALALIAPGCGGDEAASAGAGETASGKAEVASAPPGVRGEATAGGPGAERPAGSARCRRTLGGFLDAIESLANTVAIGLDYERYLGAVNGVRSTYAEVDADRLGLVCLGRVAGPSEAALNLYIDAANEWGQCLADSSCEPESVEARLQRRWREASDRFARARRGLRIRD